ncbi:MAG: hypothetical protein GIKADHBN_00800 [Phycisphaerales bacterium]|nr:hypothetical protein [Phycisphaerales bacterium]
MIRPALVLLPGVGADHRLFRRQQTAFANLVVPPWLTAARGETFESYADRMALHIRAILPAGVPVVLGGASMGGMLAVQMAPMLRPRVLVLLGSCLDPREITAVGRAAGRTARLVGPSGVDRLRALAPAAVHSLGPMTRAQRCELLEMTDALPAEFLVWAARAIFRWNGAPRPRCRLLRVHGSLDRIITPPTTPIDLLLARAGHVPSVTHADQVNQVIADALQLAAADA